MHGHRDSLNNVVQNMTTMTRKFPDCIFLAHYHRDSSDEKLMCDVIVNPSLAGPDDYAIEKRLLSKPAQKLIIFDKEEGKLCTYSLQLA